MKTLISCAYNIDIACVELKFSDGSMIAIDTIVAENEIARNMYERSEPLYHFYPQLDKGYATSLPFVPPNVNWLKDIRSI